MKICEEYAALLDPFVDGELPPEEMLRVQGHLEACPACRAYVDDALAIRAAFPGAEDAEVPEGFAEAVTAAIRAGAAPRKRKAAPWAKAVLPLAACCAIVILLVKAPFIARSDSGSDGAAPAMAMETAGGAELAIDDAGTEPEESGPFSQEKQPAEESIPSYADLPACVNVEAGLEEALEDRTVTIYGQADAPEAPPLDAPNANSEDGGAPVLRSSMDGEWVEYGNVVFACVVYLPADTVGDALDGYEGKPYSNVNWPEDGVVGTGYALEDEEFERLLDELEYPVGPVLNQDRTTELRCIVVTD